MPVVSRPTLEGTTMTDDSIGVLLAKNKGEVSTDDILQRIIKIGSVYFRSNLNKTAFLLHLCDEIVSSLV